MFNQSRIEDRAIEACCPSSILDSPSSISILYPLSSILSLTSASRCENRVRCEQRPDTSHGQTSSVQPLLRVGPDQSPCRGPDRTGRLPPGIPQAFPAGSSNLPFPHE